MLAFPNPTADVLNVSIAGNDADGRGTAGAVELLDGRGRVIRSLDLLPGVIDHSLTLKGLPSGVYFLTFTTDENRQVKRIIKR